jgi:hypothetical protein
LYPTRDRALSVVVRETGAPLDLDFTGQGANCAAAVDSWGGGPAERTGGEQTGDKFSPLWAPLW